MQIDPGECQYDAENQIAHTTAPNMMQKCAAELNHHVHLPYRKTSPCSGQAGPSQADFGGTFIAVHTHAFIMKHILL